MSDWLSPNPTHITDPLFLIITHKFHLIELNSISLRLTNKINASSYAKET